MICLPKVKTADSVQAVKSDFCNFCNTAKQYWYCCSSTAQLLVHPQELSHCLPVILYTQGNQATRSFQQRRKHGRRKHGWPARPSRATKPNCAGPVESSVCVLYVCLCFLFHFQARSKVHQSLPKIVHYHILRLLRAIPTRFAQRRCFILPMCS